MKNLGIKPYTEKLKEMRARRLAKEFPAYDQRILHEYVATDPMISA